MRITFIFTVSATAELNVWSLVDLGSLLSGLPSVIEGLVSLNYGPTFYVSLSEILVTPAYGMTSYNSPSVGTGSFRLFFVLCSSLLPGKAGVTMVLSTGPSKEELKNIFFLV